MKAFLHGTTAAVSSIWTICFSSSLHPDDLTRNRYKSHFFVGKLQTTVLLLLAYNFDFIVSEKSHSPWLEWQFKLTTGYFISDTIQMYMQGPGCTHRLGFVAHHILCAVAVYTTLHTSIGYFFIGFKMMTELSTPFMNIR